ncbi:unnamed protein product [Prunus armeniaca]
MSVYLAKAKKLLDDFIGYEIIQIPWLENAKADSLARLASSFDIDLGRSIPVEFLEKPSIEEDRVGVSSRYLIINNKLYKRGFSLPYLRCLTPDEANYALREIHEGVCGNHSSTRSLTHKALRQGYYWLTLQADAKTIAQTCLKCQEYAVVPHQPPENLTSISSPWPFAQWGIDLIGPMPKGKGQTKFAIAVVDYFTKWAEAEPLATIMLVCRESRGLVLRAEGMCVNT